MNKTTTLPALSVYSELQIIFSHGLDMDCKWTKMTKCPLRIREICAVRILLVSHIREWMTGFTWKTQDTILKILCNWDYLLFIIIRPISVLLKLFPRISLFEVMERIFLVIRQKMFIFEPFEEGYLYCLNISFTNRATSWVYLLAKQIPFSLLFPTYYLEQGIYESCFCISVS